jgi:hypothetical protein
VTYITKKGILPEHFSAEKEDLFCKLLDMDAVFEGGFSVGCEAVTTLAALAGGMKQYTAIVPRPLLDNLEKLAIAIHELYNQKQLENNPNEPLSYPRFSDLPDTLKYSNLRQARGIADKLDRMGWEMRPQGSDGEVIEKIPDEIVETLAQFEHEEWVRERVDSGWMYGGIKDTKKKISPYLVPYDELTEKIKENDRDAIRNIPGLLGMIGMAVFIKKENI